MASNSRFNAHREKQFDLFSEHCNAKPKVSIQRLCQLIELPVSSYYYTPVITLEVDYASNYRLSLNQKGNGLCTAEVVMELLKRQYQEAKFEALKYTLQSA